MVWRRVIKVPPSSPPQKKEKKITSQPAAIQFFLLDSGSAEKVQFLYKHHSMCGFIAQLVEQRTGNAEVTGFESR